jgi:hypothetical protein
MRAGLVASAVLVAVCLSSGSSEARGYAHRHGHCGYALHYDYTHSNNLSPLTYIYPMANWGPFFQCHLYRTPVVYVYPPGPY